MTRIRFSRVGRAISLTVSVALLMLVSGVTSAEAATPAPRIIARPNNAMVNTTISLAGRGFPPSTRLRIAECSMTTWVVVAQHPCRGSNTISVRTNGGGRFTSSFTVSLCGSRSGSNQTQRTCYIGNPDPQGVDTITLVGAARITVTYP